ncbi:hypothetical protein GY45DRAFT_1331965 [Cubamyces sp. BRFM 1775]|nr:hypothetical protein GY45DRAFT_1331965 [Cubamyces sp. BRFM 1775]
MSARYASLLCMLRRCMTDASMQAAEKSLAILRSSPEQATANLASGEFCGPIHMRHAVSVRNSKPFFVPKP